MFPHSRPMPKRCLRVAAALIAAGVAGAAVAGDLSTQVDLASDRLFRGLSQNNGISASARGDYAFDRHFYAGAFVGNNRSAGDAELDVYAGARRSLLFDELIACSLDAGISASVYTGDREGPRAQNLDYAEAYAGIAVGPAALKLFYAPDYYHLGGAGLRASATLRLPLTERLGTAATVAWNDGSGVHRLIATRRAPGRGGQGYADYTLSLSQRLGHDWSAQLQLGGSNLELDGRRWPRLLVGLQKRFDF